MVKSPEARKKFGGAVGITAVGMYGKGPGRDIPVEPQTTFVTSDDVPEVWSVANNRPAPCCHPCPLSPSGHHPAT